MGNSLMQMQVAKTFHAKNLPNSVSLLPFLLRLFVLKRGAAEGAKEERRTLKIHVLTRHR